MDPPNPELLCQRCEALKLDENLSRLQSEERSYSEMHRSWKIADLGKPSSWDESTCALCYLLKVIHSNRPAGYSDDTKYSMHAFISYKTRGLSALPSAIHERSRTSDFEDGVAAFGFIFPINGEDMQTEATFDRDNTESEEDIADLEEDAADYEEDISSTDEDNAGTDEDIVDDEEDVVEDEEDILDDEGDIPGYEEDTAEAYEDNAEPEGITGSDEDAMGLDEYVTGSEEDTADSDDGHDGYNPNDPFTLRQVPEYVDLAQIKRWVKRGGMTNSRDWRGLSVKENPYFKLVDCDLREVVQAPQKCKYAALSYVCGNLGSAADVHEHDRRLPETVPATIEDAITVTKGLGLKYLWVDRYCIFQDDIHEKAQQIPRMDAIYSSAHATIFAAAGTDANHGLPGVSKPRVPNRQPVVRVGKYELTWSLPDAPRLVSESTWNTRGWTLQEMYFCGHRLKFTNLQVYWECRWNVFHSEAWDIYPFSNTEKIPTHSSSVDYYSVARYVRQYSKRKFSYDSDIIDAMRGLLRTHALDNGAEQPCQYWDVTIIPPGKVRGAFDSGDVLYYLLWKHTERSTRRLQSPSWSTSGEKFPSWSWTGWVGVVSFLRFMDFQVTGFEPEPSLVTKVQDSKGNIILWDSLRQQKPTSIDVSKDFGATIRITAPIIELHFEWLSQPPQHTWYSRMEWTEEFEDTNSGYQEGYYVKCHGDYNTYSPVHLSGDVPQNDAGLVSKPWRCVVLGEMTHKTKMYKQFKDICVLVLRYDGPAERYERVGFIDLAHRIWDDVCEEIKIKEEEKEEEEEMERYRRTGRMSMEEKEVARFPDFIQPLQLERTIEEVHIC
ncbi:hypothetical protein TWF696_006884 [Orbilia brochopaga]|uniref:Heterokaryon incompatibility domain-containing protein n=1 Tax=Orbilia brochopaga TaxID=3140254 RepID=A0AAV9UR29_9PEZI